MGTPSDLEMRAHAMTRYYVLQLEEAGIRAEVGVRCEPDTDGFEMSVLVRSPVPKNELPIVVAEKMEDWVGVIRKEYHQHHLMSLP